MWPPALMDWVLEQEKSKRIAHAKSDGLILFGNELVPITGHLTETVSEFVQIEFSVWSGQFETIRDLMLAGF